MIQGQVHPDFQAAADVLDEQVTSAGRGGAALCVYHRGEKVVDIWGGARDEAGTPWTSDTMAMSFSTTKGVASTALHMCADRGLIGYDDLVVEHWPEFARGGPVKKEITVRQVLCHEAGLYELRSWIDHADEMLDWDAMVDVMERLTPAFAPGTANAYQGITYGWLVGELVRRVSGKPLGEFVRMEIAEPLGLDGLHIGLPPSEQPRVAELLMPATARGPLHDTSKVFSELAEAMGLVIDFERIKEALAPKGMEDVFRRPEALEAEIPAANGVFTARSLARMYAALAGGGELDGVRLMSGETLAEAATVQNTRPDLVIVFPIRWRLGYHSVFTPNGFLDTGFGHFGFGGSGAWADPAHDVAVGMVLNRLAGTAVGDDRMIRVNGAVLDAATAR